MTWGDMWLADFAPKLAAVYIVMIAVLLAASMLKMSAESTSEKERDE